ncbi:MULTISPECIES: 23S rRNA (adenine(2030)-N(6))-methyltransferase RlmJ [Acidithiobacillus]|jgi:23S rRNA (adenine2030-N6)-methyltransferase|uniref:Ribosomal RNA large subunit methyltransferase J n=2 Tax=Acidithiobacillus TaxID=119977 RepID=A0A179BIP5_ACIFR|nr:MULTISPECIES: 23S rRNA (adenine(2030)-N(6))-methyltransferase RlmJ [Acidithiobacillus]MEB8488473.1 23S rRNA (adenine(2030)-N(6))-methyltransferase RlmJ [Acidithiobacillus ferriphilus]MEB8491158.1 23S rRNA (adenine(2030)-N(6))-methyltransferase RlmJ [Acidithiobacillus ferriphilus]MEB8491664.1 23S rRNA (adenine(2030)-N(6))-methyltransferase RlmJ [Acidithiobacillus ferriphilus]MEB8514176.1 23S rRNA (adenine(2030)-N(6))-methyltransferase RlmJ [Acidithiobacillus ferriphilus]MEB8520814.1 23S rRNA
MNYDHHHHAGNAADCVKHLALSLTLQALIRKDTPLAYIDTHAGAGQYTLGAQGEHLHGVSRLWADRRSLPHAGAWLKIISNENGDGMLRHYPGSPVLAATLLRPGDRMVLCEQQPEVATRLRKAMGQRAHTSILSEDGYRALFGLIPPPEKRGLVLIDPPFERRDEWERLADTLIRAYRRWPQGVYLVWYPVKIRGTITRLWQALRKHLPAFTCELLQMPEEGREQLFGSGLIVVNAPWGLREALSAALTELGPLLTEAQSGGLWSLRCQGWPGPDKA